jgi:excisionase family DNA binding protein
MTSLLTPAEAAELLGVHVGTLKRWANSGAVPSSRTVGNHRRFDRAEILKVRDGLENRATERVTGGMSARGHISASSWAESPDERLIVVGQWVEMLSPDEVVRPGFVKDGIRVLHGWLRGEAPRVTG